MTSIRLFLQKPWLYLVIISTGILLKFYHLDYKLFWYDEICTVLHTSGKTIDEYSENIPANKVLSIQEYQSILRLNNNSDKISSQFRGFSDMTNLNPLHYPLLMIWHRVVGDKPVHFRLFSVFVFILSLLIIYFLSKLLFQSGLAGLIAASLFSISPFIHLFAQEARYYMLWLFLVLALHYTFLLSIETKRTGRWGLYVATGIVTLYCSPITSVVIFGHFVYMVILYRRQFLRFAISVGTMLIGYLPWMIRLITRSQEISSALEWSIHGDKVPVLFPTLAQSLGFVRIFSFYKSYMFYFDMFEKLTPDIVIEILINIAIFVLIIYSLVLLIKKTGKKISCFIVTCILPGFIFIYITDLIRNSSTSMWWRYQIFNVVGIFLLVTYSLSKKIERGKVLFAGILAGLVIVGGVSVFTISQHRFWYLGGQWQQKFITSADLLSGGDKTLVITDFTYWLGPEGLLTVLNECKSDEIDIIRVSGENNTVKEIAENEKYTDIYVFCASGKLVSDLKTQFKERMDSLEVKAISPMWKINTN
jgi:uncharacterized membrane protein